MKEVKKAIFLSATNPGFLVFWLLILKSSLGHFQAVLWIIEVKNVYQARNRNRVCWTCLSVGRILFALYFITTVSRSATHISTTALENMSHMGYPRHRSRKLGTKYLRALNKHWSAKNDTLLQLTDTCGPRDREKLMKTPEWWIGHKENILFGQSLWKDKKINW